MDFQWSKDLLLGWGVSEKNVILLNLLFLLSIAGLVMYIFDLIFRKVIVRNILVAVKRTSTQFDDHLVANKTFVYVSRLILLMIFRQFLTQLLVDFPESVSLWMTIADILLLFSWYLLFKAILRSIRDHLSTKQGFQDKPLGSYLQVADIVLIFILSIILFTLITGQDPWNFLTAFGAASAIVMLVFKDTILGFVASIQVSVNDMVRIGDWIEMPKYNADGDVIEINLNTVKVRNWDKTITTVPTHYLVTDSFKNWRGMSESGGRRIKRALHIKIASIQYVKADQLEELKKIHLLAPYIEERQQEITAYNEKTGADRSMPVNGRNFTNIGLFREYVRRYLRDNARVNQDMTLLVRQRDPSEFGVPLELYLFSADVRWAYYEDLMSDIFDHLFATIKYFDLEVFEAPASDDLRMLLKATSSVQTRSGAGGEESKGYGESSYKNLRKGEPGPMGSGGAADQSPTDPSRH